MRAFRSRRWRNAAAVGLVLAAFGGAVWVLGWSDLLGVREVDVVGAQRAPEALVTLTADVPHGTPLARVDTREVADRLQALPVIETVAVQRAWPHTLRIVVVERQPVAVVKVPEGWRLVDGAGVAFATVAGRPADIPELKASLGAGDDASAVPALQAGVAVMADLPGSLAERVHAVRVRSPADVRLVLRTGATVRWGDTSAGERKGAVLLALLKHPAQRYDVSAPDAPTTKG